MGEPKMKRIFSAVLCLCLVLLLVFAHLPLARADDWPPPCPFYVLSADESRVFHVTPDGDWADFPATGLYYNTQPLIPIYLVENPCWTLWDHDFFFSDDMQYFVWIPRANAKRHSFNAAGATALVFYANGIVQKTYMVSDLVHDFDALTWTTSTVRWLNSITPEGRRDISFAEDNRLTVRTVDGETYVFDITSGEMIEAGRVGSAIFFAVGGLVLIGGVTLLIVQRRRA